CRQDERAMKTVLVDTEDLGEAEVVASANFAKMRMIVSSRDVPTRTRFVRSSVGALTVDDIYFGYDMRYEMDPPVKILLSRFHTGGIEAQRPQQEPEWFGPGDVAAFGAVDGVTLKGVIRRAHYDLLSVDRQLFTEVAAGPAGLSLEPVRLT